ncbi:hypothetical protein Peur_044507 [Populus x canadensis]
MDRSPLIEKAVIVMTQEGIVDICVGRRGGFGKETVIEASPGVFSSRASHLQTAAISLPPFSSLRLRNYSYTTPQVEKSHMNLVRYKRRYYCDFGFDPSVKTS